MIKFLIVLFPLISFAKAQPELTFSSAIEVSPRAEISAYDIVEAKNLDEDMVSELKQIHIGDSKTNRIEKMALAKMLRPLRAHFILPSELKILRSKNAVSRMEVERKIKNHIHMNCATCDVQIQVSSVPSNLPSDWNLDLNVDMSKTSTMIPIYSSRQPDRKGWVVAEIKRYQKIPVLNRSVKVGDVITEDMLALEKRQITNLRETAQNADSIMGMQAVRFMNAGQTILFSDLKKEQVMKKGQMVKAISGNSSFEVSMSALVEEGGSIGDVIRIKNIDSQKVFAAKVVERGLVRIE
ncbi:MAG: flagellar basal body P-ring formation protein FlgA [Bdellovibrio sp.]|nr:flagellar basal body P-ring formation protein FlgA [Bdellovibrio sp.]